MEIFLIILIILGTCFYLIQKERQRKIVLENSLCLKAITALNNKFGFKIFDYQQCYQRICKTKPQFDSFNIHNHMLLTIEAGPEFFESLAKAVEYNRNKYPQYEKQYNQITQMYLSKTDYKEPFTKFKI